MANRKLGKYDIRDRLGRGGMAEVYRAYHSNLDRFVAIKVLHAFLADDPEFKTRFEREAQNVAKLRHPNIVQVYDFDYDNESESYYMVMELVDGPTLKDWLAQLNKRSESVEVDESVRIIREAAGALAYAHSRSMIHRDVKPANLMLDHDRRVVLTDFGIAKIVTGAQFTASGGMVGTPAYMAPEQGLGEAGDERSDLYSLGVILYQLTTGQLPYDAETPLAIILKHLNAPIPSVRSINPKVPEAIDHIVQKAMAKEPQDRYQTANDLIEDLDRLQRGDKVNASIQAEGLPPVSSQDTVKVSNPIAVTNETIPSTPLKGREQQERHIPWWGWGGILVGILVGLFLIGEASGVFSKLTATTTPALATTQVSVSQKFTATPNAYATASAAAIAAIPTRTPAPIFSPTPVLTRTPTFTLTPSVTFTLTPTLTYTPATPIAQSRSGIVMRNGPALYYAVNGNIQGAERLTILAISKDSLWFWVVAQNGQRGWVASRDVDAFGNIASLPFAEGPTLTPTYTLTPTVTPSPTLTPTYTLTPTITNTPTPTLTPSPNVTLTLAFAVTVAAQQTATATACVWDYAVVAEDPPDAVRRLSGQPEATPQPVLAGTPYTRQITLQNTGTCAWEPNTALKFIAGTGDDFNAGPRIFIRDEKGQPVRVGVGDTVVLTFQGQTPSKGQQAPYTGTWELVTPGQIRIGQPLPISIRAYGG